MAGNSFGENFKVTTFGESHGAALGVIIDGMPAGIDFDAKKIQDALDKRKPGQTHKNENGSESVNAFSTARKESDKAEILSGIFEEKTTGTPIAILIRNENQHSSDYNNIKNTFRPGHADFTFFEKYGIRDYRGGGRSSGRETCARVAAGAVAQMLLDLYQIKIKAYTKEAAGIKCKKINLNEIENNLMRAPDSEAAKLMEEKIASLRKEGNSAGGIVECIVSGLPAGLGEPVFDKADAMLAHACLSIGAVKGIEFGAGFELAQMYARQSNDQMSVQDKKIIFETNNAGGILGGITRGDDLIFRLAVKAVPSIFLKQKTITTSLENTEIEIQGRHDICLCPRIVPVVEAMTAITLADLLLRNRCAKK